MRARRAHRQPRGRGVPRRSRRDAERSAGRGRTGRHGDEGALDALYEGEIHAATIDGQVYDLVEGTALPATVADSNSVDGSLCRIPDGSDTDDAATDWVFTSTKTPGAANVASS